MKLLFSAYACDPYKGSEAGNGWNWAYLNSLKGHEVWCLTSMRNHESIQKRLKEQEIPGLHIVFVKVPKWVDYVYRFGPIIYFSYMYWQYQAYKTAKKIHRKVKFDIVQHTTWGSLQLGTFLWKLNVPLIFGPCGGGQFPPKNFRKYFYEFWRTETTRKTVSDLFLKINPNVKQTLKKAKLVLTTNRETYDMAVANGASHVELFLDTSLPEEFYPKTFPERPILPKMRILWVGRLFARKGLPVVLEALSRVRKEVNYEITILGDGPMSKYIPEWLSNFKLENTVKWLGRVPWEQVKNAYKDHDVFMFCSLRDSSAAQFLEAMAYGLPVITLNLHGAKNLVPDDAGLKIDVSSPEKTINDLAKAVEHLYFHPEERAKMGVNGYNFAKTQTWDIKTGTINNYYESIAREFTQANVNA